MRLKLFIEAILPSIIMLTSSCSKKGCGEYPSISVSPIIITEHFFELADRAAIYVNSDNNPSWEYIAEGQDLSRLVDFFKKNKPTFICRDVPLRSERNTATEIILERKSVTGYKSYAYLTLNPEFFIHDGTKNYQAAMSMIRRFKVQKRTQNRIGVYMETKTTK